jgi:hypothetical protein
MESKLHFRYRQQRANARGRGIRWRLTFEEWLRIWEQSGHLNERGCRSGQYCMARYGDKGPYVAWNVKIITHSSNVSEGDPAYRRLGHTLESYRKQAESLRGRKQPYAEKLKRALSCRKLSQEQLAELKRSYIPLSLTHGMRAFARKFGVHRDTIKNALKDRYKIQ